MSYRVSGKLIKSFIPCRGLYKYDVQHGYRYFKTLDEAIKYADKVYKFTHIVLSIKEIK